MVNDHHRHVFGALVRDVEAEPVLVLNVLGNADDDVAIGIAGGMSYVVPVSEHLDFQVGAAFAVRHDDKGLSANTMGEFVADGASCLDTSLGHRVVVTSVVAVEHLSRQHLLVVTTELVVNLVEFEIVVSKEPILVLVSFCFI